MHLNHSLIPPCHFQKCRYTNRLSLPNIPMFWQEQSAVLRFTACLLESRAPKIMHLFNTKPGRSYLNNSPLLSSSICPPCAPLPPPDTRVADGTNGLTGTRCLSAEKESGTFAETLDTALRSRGLSAEKSNIWIVSSEGLDDLMFFVVSFLSYFSDPFCLSSAYTLNPPGARCFHWTERHLAKQNCYFQPVLPNPYRNMDKQLPNNLQTNRLLKVSGFSKIPGAKWIYGSVAFHARMLLVTT